jgi:uncharacterized membrane protein
MSPYSIPGADLFALPWFLAWAFGYTWYSRRRARRRSPSLVVAMFEFRKEWFTRMITRENRIGDIAAVNGLQSTSTFFASTSILILGGLIALLGNSERVMDVVSEIPFTRHATVLVWQVKIILLIFVFVYAFFKFTWSVRQFNFCAILVCAAPKPTPTPQDHPHEIALLTEIASYGAENFNQGLRAYYFAMAVVTWFLHPWLFMVAAVSVVYVLYQREYHSRTLYALIARRPGAAASTVGAATP